MTDEELEGLAARLEQLAGRATFGPWSFDHDWHRIPSIVGRDKVCVAHIVKAGFPNREDHTTAQEADAKLIVELRNNLPTILAALRARKAKP